MVKGLFRSKVTVMMPAYNAARYIAESIESVLRQDFPFFELVIFDDGSTDRTYEIVRRHQKFDSRIRVHHSETNRGVSYARNRILKLARGKYLAPHDADDIMLNGRLKRQVRLLDRRPEIGVVFGKAMVSDGNGKSLRDRCDSDVCRLDQGEDPKKSQILHKFSLGIAHSSVMMRKSLVLRAGGYDERLKFGEDGDLFYRLWNKTRFYFLNFLCYIYRIHTSSLMSRAQRLREALNIVDH